MRSQAVVTAAERGVEHLRTHVGAHDRWAAGEISDEEKAATYKRTRLAGPQDLAIYDAATRVMGSDLSACNGQQTPCAQRMETLKRALPAAQSGMEHWRTHLGNMAAFDEGAFGARRAQRLWEGTIEGMDHAASPMSRAEADLQRAPACS